MNITLGRNRLTLLIVGFFVLLAAATMPFTSASCRTLQRPEAEPAALARLRALAAGQPGLSQPGFQLSAAAEPEVARIEAQAASPKVAGLARLLRARIKAQAGDYAAAVKLLDNSAPREAVVIGDYWRRLRADYLERLNRRAEARAAYEQIVRDYPTSLVVREAILRSATLAQADGATAVVPVFLKRLTEQDDPAALLLTAKAYEQQGQATPALIAYRRLYFYAPASPESAEAASALLRLGSTASPATIEEAVARADKLLAAKRYLDATDAYREAIARFPLSTNSADLQLRNGIAAFNAGRAAEAITTLTAARLSATSETRLEALYYLTQTYARSKQWDAARLTTAEMRRLFPTNPQTARALVAAGMEAKDAKNSLAMFDFFRTAVSNFPGSAEVAGAQFELAWAAHESKNFVESARLLLEHLAAYADKNTDNRGRAGYWAARDAERAGKLADAATLYNAMLRRYEANWYGYLAKQRLAALKAKGIVATATQQQFGDSSPLARAVQNLSTVTVAEESAGATENDLATKAEQLGHVGLDTEAFAELNKAAERAPDSPRINLAVARLHRLRGENLLAFSTLRRSFPDYAQMDAEELTGEEWDVFYPLAYWPIIIEEARAKQLDPYMVAGLIRQESVFDPRARSSARAYGLMQLLVPTGQALARKYNIPRTVTVDSLFDPALNIKLGTAYMRDQFDSFGRVEYVAAAYNAGPGRAVRWRAELPAEIDEWAEAVPFRETRGYIQGVVRNMLQYKRLYTQNGEFRPEVGTRAARSTLNPSAAPDSTVQPTNAAPSNQSMRPRRSSGEE